MVYVREILGPQVVSERRACEVLGHARSTQRRKRVVADDEARLRARIVELAEQYGRYGVWWVKYQLATDLTMGFSPAIGDVDHDGDADLLMRGLGLGGSYVIGERETDVTVFLQERGGGLTPEATTRTPVTHSSLDGRRQGRRRRDSPGSHDGRSLPLAPPRSSRAMTSR